MTKMKGSREQKNDISFSLTIWLFILKTSFHFFALCEWSSDSCYVLDFTEKLF